jgi:hypothetical protein
MAYLPLSTANLPDPVIDPAQGESPEDYFGTLLWTGDGTSNQSVTGLDFQPEFLWTKARNTSFGGAIFDSVRGSNATLFLDTNKEITTDANWNTMTFQSGGINTGSGVGLNNNATNFVGWSWLANGSAVSNTDGTTTGAVTVSANQKAGFSIVKYVGQHSTGGACTIGHGLNAVPQMVIAKDLDVNNDWVVYHSGYGAGQFGKLTNNNNTGFTASTTVWNNTAPTADVFSVGTANLANNNGSDYVAYAFADVDGYSKFGTFVGNQSTDGPFVYCGFRPAFLMTFLASSGSLHLWFQYDSAREPFNPNDTELYTSGQSGSDQETANSTAVAHDFLSNGFKLRTDNSARNQSGGTYVFMAFAENPFKYSNAR